MKKARSPISRENPRQVVHENRYWHAYGLQRLNPDRFRNAVNDILGLRSVLIPPLRQEMIPESFSKWRYSEGF